MKKEYWIILITYIVMQISSIFGVPLVNTIGLSLGISYEEMVISSVTIWLLFSFSITLLIVLLLLRSEIRVHTRDANTASISSSIFWSISGIFLSLFAQSFAASIEKMIGIEMGSENTQQIINLIEKAPLVILVSSLIGPILEEIVFRKIIFGTIYKRFNFFFSALISSVIFALAHFEIEHILLYSAMGFTFAFLYVKTKRIIVPMFAHVAMNTLVVILQLNQDSIIKFMKESERLTSLIGGF